MHSDYHRASVGMNEQLFDAFNFKLNERGLWVTILTQYETPTTASITTTWGGGDYE